MWSDVQSKQHDRWRWHAIAPERGQILASGLADHKARALIQLKTLLEPFGLETFYTAGWGAYERHLDSPQPVVGKVNTQKIEREPLN